MERGGLNLVSFAGHRVGDGAGGTTRKYGTWRTSISCTFGPPGRSVGRWGSRTGGPGPTGSRGRPDLEKTCSGRR
eukprot:4543354-Prymnesium_polylepis.1